MTHRCLAIKTENFVIQASQVKEAWTQPELTTCSASGQATSHPLRCILNQTADLALCDDSMGQVLRGWMIWEAALVSVLCQEAASGHGLIDI